MAFTGWSLLPNMGDYRDKLDIIMDGPNNVRVLKGDVATCFRWLNREYARYVEPINPAWCWGYNYRKIKGSNAWSKHAYATAEDINAPLNPEGVPTHTVMTPREIAACHDLELRSHGVFKWGGDFGSNPDAMHWEIDMPPNKVAEFAREIEAMATPEEIAAAVWAAKPDGLKTAGGFLIDEGKRSAELRVTIMPRVEAALALVPTAEQNAEAVVQAIGGVDLVHLSAVLHDVLGPARTAELKEML